ncbi:MAG: siphovirus Gp157 family protein [Proteobacteria bacterium]|nr:siphovirus Gp157 family protein [Pseudomonadota bacterium]
MNTDLLRQEAAHYQLLMEQLRSDYGPLDDETLADTLEGMSDLPEMIEEIVRSSLDDDALITGLKVRVDAMAARMARLKERHQKKRQLAAWAMGAAGLSRLKAVDFTVSLSEGAIRLQIGDERDLPERFLVPQPPKVDRAAVAEALKAGDAVAGASLVQGQPYITVSSR